MSLDVGQKAPDFTLQANGGSEVSLSDFAGKKVIVYFYPKDATPGCTKQACGFRDHKSQFNSKGVTIIGISKDSVKSHDKFVDKENLNFILASDEDGSACENYGVWVEKSMYGKKYMGIERSTFLIDEAGHIEKVWRKVKVPGHVEEVLAAS